MSTWTAIRDKIDRLRALDQTCQVFGADAHEYRLHPPVATSEIEAAEMRLDTSLPAALRSFYTTLGNGVAGPKYGLLPLEKIRGYRPDQPYPGVDHFKAVAEHEHRGVDEEGYFEIPYDALQGLLCVIREGCGHKLCLVSSGENAGTVVHVSVDGFVHEESYGLRALYEQWLARNIAALERVDALIDTTLSLNDIYETLKQEFGRYDGKDLVVSRIGAEKPDDLFGSGTTTRYHAASQDPWYEQQLAAYRRETTRGMDSEASPPPE